MNKLFFRLEYESDGRVECLEISYATVNISIFENMKTFQQEPIRVSFETRDYEKSFVPATFQIRRSKSSTGKNIVGLTHEGTDVGSLTDNSLNNPFNVFVFNRPGNHL